MTPKWRIQLTKTAKEQLDDLDRAVAGRVRKFVHERLALADNPRRLGRKLVDSDGVWRFRVGDYRILATIDDGEVRILVLAVGHRGRIYKKLPYPK